MSTPLRLLHVHSGNLYGGIESMLATLVRFADPARLESSFACCFEGRLSEELHRLGSRVHSLGPVRASRPWTVWRARRRLAVALREQRPDFAVFHSGWSQALFGPTAHRARVRTVRWFHGIPDPAHWLDRRARRSPSDLTICNSQFTAAGVATMGATSSSAVVYPPVPVPPSHAATSRARVRSSLGVPDDMAVILQVGRMEPGKGHRVLLSALARIRDRPDWVAWQVGGAQRDEEISYVGELGIAATRLGVAARTRFLGERSDVSALMAAADIYCQPNETPESFGITFIEALYAGLPVVTSAIGGAVEILSGGGGSLVPPGDFTALSETLQGWLSDPTARRALGAAGPNRAAKLCDPVQQLERLEAALVGDRQP